MIARKWAIEGHAIVSDDDRIADASGVTPAALRNDADRRRFQAALDRAAVVVLGRLGHAYNPNAARRPRLVLSSAANGGIERRADGIWWNPAAAPPVDALRAAAAAGGVVAVVGGQRVFDLFLEAGYDAFHLTRVAGVVIGGGPRVFSECRPDWPAERVLGDHGLRAGAVETLEAAAGVVVTVWRPDP